MLFRSDKKVLKNINLLSKESTFTITTGHQLSILTGPIFFIYKIVSIINMCVKLKREYPNVKCYVGNIEDKSLLLRVFKDVKPDVVIHAAAMKHIDLMETNPIAGCNVNVVGSLNVAEASLINDVPITIGVSTDKACLPESVYGASKYIMERVFMNTNTEDNRFEIGRAHV